MGHHQATRSREYREEELGRKRNYICRECHANFQIDILNSLPEIDRVCPDCRNRTYVYTFTNKGTGKDTQIRASDVTLATLRAWKINNNLTFKMPEH